METATSSPEPEQQPSEGSDYDPGGPTFATPTGVIVDLPGIPGVKEVSSPKLAAAARAFLEVAREEVGWTDPNVTAPNSFGFHVNPDDDSDNIAFGVAI